MNGDDSNQKLGNFPMPANSTPIFNSPPNLSATDQPEPSPEEPVYNQPKPQYDDIPPSPQPDNSNNLSYEPQQIYSETSSPEPTPEEPIEEPVYNQPESSPESDQSSDQVELTDPVVPEFTAPPEIHDTSTSNFSVPTEPVVESPRPATLPENSSTGAGRLLTVLLLIITIAAIAASVLLYGMLAKTRKDLQNLQSIKSNQTVDETTPTPTTPEIANTSPTMPPENPTSTPAPTLPASVTGTAAAFPKLEPIMKMAKEKIDTAKLIMIIVSNPQLSDKISTSYFFRESDSRKSYFKIVADSQGALTLFDRQVYVTPDNNIPSLNIQIDKGTLGMDLPEVLPLVNQMILVPAGITTTPDSVTAKYILAKIGNTNESKNIWELVYSFSGRPEVKVQLDASTKNVIYSNLRLSK